MKFKNSPKNEAFTLIELLIVIAIIAILTGVSFPALKTMREKAENVKHVANVKDITLHTLQWAADHGQVIPSPQYPGGYSTNDPAIPEHWDFTGTGTGLWLDGVIYHAATSGTIDSDSTANGDHLRNTIFFSNQSLSKDPMDKNMYRHSYAMNQDLQYDYVYADSGNPELTNKSLARITHSPSALLFIENQESNVIGYQDRMAIIETGRNRWASKKVIASFLDGSARTLSKSDIPEGSIDNDIESSRFWRGVDPDR